MYVFHLRSVPVREQGHFPYVLLTLLGSWGVFHVCRGAGPTLHRLDILERPTPPGIIRLCFSLYGSSPLLKETPSSRDFVLQFLAGFWTSSC
jgi:hypothetical protein